MPQQTQDNPRLRTFYDDLAESGAIENLPDFDRFKSVLTENEGARRMFYRDVQRSGAIANLPDFETFNRSLFNGTQPKADTEQPARPETTPISPDFATGRSNQITVSNLNFAERLLFRAGKLSPVLNAASVGRDLALSVTDQPNVKELALNPEELSRIESAAGSMIGTIAENAGNIPKWIGTTAQKISTATGLGPEQNMALEDLATWQIGEYIQNTAQEIWPTNPEYQQEFLTGMVPTMAGEVASFFTTGSVNRGLGFMTAMFSGGVREYENALEATGDEDVAFNTFLINTGIGATEMVPVMKLFSRLNKASGGAINKFMSRAIRNPTLRESLLGASEEALQEMVQTGLTNVTAENLYDTTRELTDGLWEGAAAGGVVGFLMNLMGVSMRRMRDRRELEQIEQVEQSLAHLEQQKRLHQADLLGDVPRDDLENPFLGEYTIEPIQQQARQEFSIEQEIQQLASERRRMQQELEQARQEGQPTEQLETQLAAISEELTAKRQELSERSVFQQDEEAETQPDEPLPDPAENIIGPTPPEGTIYVAFRAPDGTVYAGGQGDAHINLVNEYDLDVDNNESGFVDSQGRFFTEAGKVPGISMRERGAFTTQKEKGTLDEEFVEEFEQRGERLYQPVPDDATVQQAEQYVETHGVEEAKIAVLNKSSKLAFRQRVAIGHKILTDLDTQFRQLKADGDPRAINKLDEQIDFANQFYKLGTELGRGVRAFAYYSKFSPEAHLRAYQRQINKAKAEGKDVAYDQDVARKILLKSRAIQKMPEGFKKQEATQDLMAFVANQTPISKTDVAVSLAYANILSGYQTQIVNFAATAINVWNEGFTLAIANPRASWDIIVGSWQGFMKGIREARAIMRTGKIVGTRSFKGQIPAILERKNFKGLLKPLNLWKYVGRTMSASDVLWFKTAEEMRARVLARHIAQKEGGTEKSITTRVNEILGNTDQIKARARAQAEAEGHTGDDFQRRVYELVEQQRPADLMDSASEFALKATFNNTPEGYLGFIAKKISEMNEGIPALRTVVPFTKIVSNVTNVFLDYTPAGYARLFNNVSGHRRSPDMGDDLWRQQAAKATMGTVGMMLLAWKVSQGLEEDDPYFTVTGRGTGNFRRDYQLQETGWKPYSIKLGDNYISYRETPFGLAFSLVGNYYDAIRYRNLEEHDAARRVSYALRQVPHTLLNMSFLSGLSDFFTAASRENISADESIIRGVVEGARGFVVPNLARQITDLFDPQIYTSDDISEALVRDFPVARNRVGQPIINVLGEPVRGDFTLTERALRRFVSIRKSDPIWQTLIQKQAFISHPYHSQSTLTTPEGDTRNMTKDEYYNYMLLSGRKIKTELQRNLSQIQRMPPAQAQEFVRSLTREARSITKREIMFRHQGAPKLTPASQ